MRVASPLTLQPEERRELEREFIMEYQKSPYPFVLTVKVDDILRKIARLRQLQTTGE